MTATNVLHYFAKSFCSLLIALFLCPFAMAQTQAAPRICAIYPHLKDSYWLSINYGMVSEAKNQHVDLKVLEAGGYSNKAKQQQLFQLCVDWHADAIILSTVTPSLYYNSLAKLVGHIPVFALVNQLQVDPNGPQVVQGTVGVDWFDMGYSAGNYLATKHPKGSAKVNVVLLPGPKSKGGTKPSVNGFLTAIKGSAVQISTTLWADNDKELQRNLLQQALSDKDAAHINYIVGNAVAIEAAISELRSVGRTDTIGLVAMYFSHGVYRGLLRHKVEFAPTDKMVDQGRQSIIQASHYLRQLPYEVHSVPTIIPLTPQTLTQDAIQRSLSPSEYRPIFAVKSIE